MLRRRIAPLLVSVLFAGMMYGAPPRTKIQGYCERGGKTITTLGYVSSNKTQESFPSCWVTVYTASVIKPLPAIYEDDLGNLKIGNPFQADGDGYWYFYADDGRYDVQFSGVGILPAFTRGDFQAFDWRFIQPGVGTPLAGAVARSVKLKLAETLSVKDLGVKGDGTTDDTAAINIALITSSTVGLPLQFPPGIYKITQIVVPVSNVKMLGPGLYNNSGTQAVLVATAATPMISTSYGVNSLRIAGLTFRGSGIATAGIFLDGAVQVEIDHNQFADFPAGAKGIKGGGALYNHIHHNSFGNTFNGMGLDYQNAYSSFPGSSYYGCNDCWFEYNLISASQGNRISGVVYFEHNDVEQALNAGGAVAALEMCDTSAGSFTVSHNYFELHQGTQPDLIGMQVCTGMGALEAVDNTMFGNVPVTATSIAIVDGGTGGSAYNYGGQITGNKLSRWNTGIIYAATRSGYGTGVILSNRFLTVANPIAAAAFQTVSTVANQGAGQFFHDPLHGFFFGNDAIAGAVVIYGAGASLDLSRANTFGLNYAAPATINATTNSWPGMFFTIHFITGNITVSNAYFHLLYGSDVTPAANSSLHFFVDLNGVVREVGSSWENETPFSYNSTSAFLVQNGVNPFTSLATGAVANTLSLKTGHVSIGTTATDPYAYLYVYKSHHHPTKILLDNPDTTVTDLETEVSYELKVAGNLVGALKSTAGNLTGLSGPSLYLTTIGNYPIALGTNSSPIPGAILDINGRWGVGTTNPKSKLHVVGIVVYANNAAAIAAGLTAGAFYRTGADPDPIMVVH